jgi:hypothetical protein
VGRNGSLTPQPLMMPSLEEGEQRTGRGGGYARYLDAHGLWGFVGGWTKMGGRKREEVSDSRGTSLGGRGQNGVNL